LNETERARERNQQDAKNFEMVEYMDNGASVSVYNPRSVEDIEDQKDVAAKDRTQFNFDHVFGPSSTQVEVYIHTVQHMAAEILAGYNCTVFAYGQTSSGKTHCMFGPTGAGPSTVGIIPRIVAELFERMKATTDGTQYTVKISFFEVYLEEIHDLLRPENTNLKIRESKSGDIHVEDLKEVFVTDVDKVLRTITRGTQHRVTASTQMNARSSRSHSVFQMTVLQDDGKHAKLTLVDLAGSERVKKSGAHGLTMTQAQHINTSLLMLGNVINALTENKPHIPYRNSKLTRLLQPSLGGNSKTCVIVTCSPSWYNLEETYSTLRFGTRAKRIRNKPRVNQELTLEAYKLLLAQAETKLEELRKLKGNVHKAEEFIRLKEDLEAALSESTEKDAQIDRLREIIRERDDEIEALREELSSYQVEKQRIEMQAEEQEAKIQEMLVADTADVIASAANLNVDVMSPVQMKQVISKLSHSHCRLKTRNDYCFRILDSRKLHIDAIERALRESDGRIKDLTSAVAQLETELRTSRRESAIVLPSDLGR